ncbi:MAG: aminopeptidase P family protein [Armatimonadetes bacterium]|nr:aminopeptidase P family protein [Armatimonadota bacterium]
MSVLYQQRAERLRMAMLQDGVDLYLAATQVNMGYFSGFREAPLERMMFLAIPLKGDPIWFMPSLSAESAQSNSAGYAVRYVWHDSEGYRKALGQFAHDLDLGSAVIAVDDETPSVFLLGLQEAIPGALFRSGWPTVAKVRSIKDANEIAHMRAAAALTDAAVADGLELCAPGHTEIAIGVALERALAQSGSRLAFAGPIVASGPNSSKPHYEKGHREVQPGDVVVIDFGGVVEGYCNDITRCVCVGRANDDVRRVYETVHRAYEAGLETAGPGVPAQEVDRAARKVIADAGYGEYFVHRTGHGIGLSVHEPPYIVETNAEPLQAGNCFTIEPGIYLPGQFGIRIENVCLVTESGCESLNAEPSADIREIG